MKAYILKTSIKIDPLGDYARDCLIGNKQLQQLQAETLRTAGLEPVFVDDVYQVSGAGECIVLRDNLYFSAELMKEFVTRSRELKIMTFCSLKAGDITTRTGASVQNVQVGPDCVKYRLRYFPELEKSTDGQVVVVIDPDELHASIPIPRHMCGAEKYAIPMTTKFVIQLDHWVNLWIANVVSALGIGARLQSNSKAKQLLLALKARSLNQWKILRHLNTIGSGCDIHPAAYVEGSSIGNNVSLGAGAIVRNSIIGNNVSIGNGVAIEESVVGDGCVILNGRLIFSTMYPRSFSVTDMITASLVGSECFLGNQSIMTDFRLDNKNVTVIKNGQSVDSGNRFLGSCLGHGVYLGSGCVIAPGRTIPNGVRLALAPDRIIRGCLDNQSDIEGYRIIKSE